jgi:hypothetical protein
LQHDRRNGEHDPTEIQQWDRRENPAHINSPGDVPKACASYEQFGGDDQDFRDATMAWARETAGYTVTHATPPRHLPERSTRVFKDAYSG